MDIIKQYGTPLRITYLPRISENIRFAQSAFNGAMERFKYQGSYTYCYCTKSSHYDFVLEEALKNEIHIETSSAFDIPIVRTLYERGKISKDTFVLCNGFKMPQYKEYITGLLNESFNCIPILDNLSEIDHYEKNVTKPYQVGIRVAADEEPKFEFYTSRLGIRYGDINTLYKEKIEPSTKASLKMLHFFINTGIKDTAYYWSELSRFIFKYCELKKICPTLDSIDIGGGFPIKTSLTFPYHYLNIIGHNLQDIQQSFDKSKMCGSNISLLSCQ